MVEAIKTTAEGITIVLNDMYGHQFPKNSFFNVYIKKCDEVGTKKYQTVIGTYLRKSDLFQIKNNKVRLKREITFDEIYNHLTSYNKNRNDRGRNTGQRIRSVPSASLNLIPLLSAFKKLNISEKLETFNYQDAPEVVKWLRNLGYDAEVSITTKL